MRLILASSSPRRREILSYLNVPFSVHAADIDETPRAGESPQAMVLRLSGEKAQAVTGKAQDGIVLAADTTVALDGEIIGKPRDESDAERILKRLRGQAHHVYTGLTLRSFSERNGAWSSLSHTVVYMREYTDQEIRAYIASARPFDKAGAYAIQDADFYPVVRIEGCYLNVMGLPLCELIRGLGALGVPLDAREPVRHDCVSSGGRPCFEDKEQ